MIPDAIVEAAASAVWQSEGYVEFAPSNEGVRDLYRRNTRDALTAALPLIEKELRAKAVARFREHGPDDARGAAIWDVASWLCDMATLPRQEPA